MIKLDGNWYSTYQNKYRHKQHKYEALEVSSTGIPVHVDSGVFTNTYDITLICTVDELALLRGSFAKASFTNSALDLIDEENFSWLATTGSDTTNVIYNSGVYFQGDINPEPMTVQGWTNNRFQVPITLYVNASGLSGNGSGTTGGNISMVHETPGGTINGVNATFTLTQTPSTLLLFRNGVEQLLGTNYTLAGSTITFLAGYIPQTGDSLDSYYTV